MKKLIYFLVVFLFSISCNEEKKEKYPEFTFVVKHSTGIDTLKARDCYTDNNTVIFYYDYVFEQKVGVFFAPYSFKRIENER